MILYPAIDLKDGACVRLLRGDMDRATVFNPDPAAQARAFEAEGATWLHLVDLDGAVAGRSVNATAVRAVIAAISIPVQLGGGIRTMDDIAGWLEAGVARVILGTAALHDPGLLVRACRRHPGRIAVAIDARDGQVATDGWTEQSGITAIDLAKRLEDLELAAIIHTDIGRDGALGGLNVAATLALAEAVALPVIASGGVASIKDLTALSAAAGGCEGRIDGVIAGRAVYDGRLDIARALALLANAPC